MNVAPVLDKCLQTWATPVLGPLWVSRGEGFSPKGVNEFLSRLLEYTQVKINEAQHYEEQVKTLMWWITDSKSDFVFERATQLLIKRDDMKYFSVDVC